jgi:hypothetical protein
MNEPEIIEAEDIEPENVWTPDDIEEEAERVFLQEVNAGLPDWTDYEADLEEKTLFDHYGNEDPR